MRRGLDILWMVAERLCYRARTYVIFRDDPEAQGGALDSAIRCFDAACPPSADVAALFRRSAGRWGALVMLGRLRRAGAVLLVLTDGAQLVSYGWLQPWRCVRREFGFLSNEGICLGPYWTNPAWRGCGVYGRMLRHSLAICRERFGKTPLYIWARSENVASVRGIERAGFAPVGTFRVVTALAGLIRYHVRCPPTVGA